MNFIKTKCVLFAILLLGIIFFSNDVGIIDIERTAIITAIALDYEDDKYLVTAQVAVPEATDVNAENTKTQISAYGETIGTAIKNIGSETGWYPQLYFCNLIIIGGEFAETNTIKIVDYFSKTLRVQDSASVVLAEEKAKDLLKFTSPLDSISSFAMQKVLLKERGFDKDVMLTDIKDFCADYYSLSSSSHIPIVSVNEQKESEESSGESQGGSSGGESSGGGENSSKKALFDPKETALFYKGVMVGKLDKDLTFTYNLIHENCKGSEITVKNVEMGGEYRNVLSIIDKNSYKTFLTVDNNGILYNVNLKLKLRITDQTATESDAYFSKNLPIPKTVKDEVIRTLTENITSLVDKEKMSGSDFLKIKENLYRFHTKYYEKYKDNFLDNLYTKITVTVI